MRNILCRMAVCAVVCISVCGCGESKKESESVRQVRIEVVEQGREAAERVFPARVVASEKVGMAFKIGGTLKRVCVGEGDAVRKGMLIAELDSRDYELQADATRAEYEGVKADAERAMTLFADSVATAADYDKARYGLERVKAKYENAKNMLADTRLYAPYDGVVERRLFDPPAVVGAGMPVLTLFSSGIPEVEIFVPASVSSRLADAVRFEARFDFTDTAVPLKLIGVNPNANANQLYKVRLSLPSDMEERPAVGMSAMVDVTLRSDDNSANVSVPAGAVFEKDGESRVWIYEGGKVASRKVRLGALHIDGSATIESGLSVGDSIVTAGVGSLTEGQRVRPLDKAGKTNIGGLL